MAEMIASETSKTTGPPHRDSSDLKRGSPLAGLIKQSVAPPWWFVFKPALHFGLLVGFIYLATLSHGIWKALCIVGAASQFLGLYSLLHGASHFHLAKNRKVNDVLGTLLAMVLGTSFHAYRKTHLLHHARLRQPDDPQEVIHTCLKNRFVTAVLLVIASLFGAAIFVWLRVPFFGAQRGSWKRVLLELLLSAAFFACVFTFVPVQFLVTLAWVLPTAIIWGSLIDITYHQGLGISGDTGCSRSLDCDRFGFWLLNGENRHAEHHAYPGVPLPNWRRLSPQVRAAFEAQGVHYEHGYLSALFKCIVQCPFFLPPTESTSERTQ